MVTQEADIRIENKVEIYEVPLLSDQDERKRIYEPNTERSASEFNGKDIQEDYFDVKSIKHEEIHIKSEDVDDHQFSNESLTVEDIKELHPTNKPAHSNGFYWPYGEPEVFKCPKCSYQTHQKNFMYRHMFIHDNSNESNMFQCPNCPYQTDKKHRIKQHEIVHIPKEKAKLHKCPKCSFTSKWKRGLTQHLIIHQKSDEITWYHCAQCPYAARCKSHLYSHTKMHIKNLPVFKCALCTYESTRKYCLKSHLKHVHRPKDIPLISCPEDHCFYKTHDQKYLATHINRFHTVKHTSKAKEMTKRFQCYMCTWGTSHKPSLARHIQAKHRDAEGRMCPNL